MIVRIFLICGIYLFGFEMNAQVISQDQLWTNDQYRIIMYRDSTFMFSKIDEPMKDMIAGKWLFRRDTFYLYSADESKLLLFSLFEQDSIHKRIQHLDPRIYNSYSGVKIPIYFYLTKTYYTGGNICSAYSFASCDETKHCFLNINHFNENGTLTYSMDLNLKSGLAKYKEYITNPFTVPREKVIGFYKNGKPYKAWHYFEWSSNGSQLIKHYKERKKE